MDVAGLIENRKKRKRNGQNSGKKTKKKHINNKLF